MPQTPWTIRTASLGLLLLTLGCTSAARSNTARTAVEQLLISNAVDQSLDKVDFQPFAGHTIFLEEKYVDCVDKAYVLGSIRHRMLAAGAHLVDKTEDAELVVEVRSGGVGTDTSESYLGVPEVVLPGMLTLPEVRFVERTSQSGMAKIGLVAYDAKSKQVLGTGGVALSKSTDNNWYVAGVGPFQEGSIRSEVTRSTTGPAAFRRTNLPAQVVFSPPASTSAGGNEIQFTSGDATDK
jgi:hypothetical protein